MTFIILSFVSKHRLNLLNNKFIHLFLILVAMLISFSADPQIITDFTTFSGNTRYGSLILDFHDLSLWTSNTWLLDFGNISFITYNE